MNQTVTYAAVTDALVESLWREWLGGRSKNDIERVEFDDPKSHGKKITALFREHGYATEKEHPMITENRRLRKLLDEHGISYDHS